MSKNKKIVSVDPGTGAGVTSDVSGENALPCSTHEKKKTDGGLRPMREYFTNDEVLPEGHPPPPYPAFGNPDRV